MGAYLGYSVAAYSDDLTPEEEQELRTPKKLITVDPDVERKLREETDRFLTDRMDEGTGVSSS